MEIFQPMSGLGEMKLIKIISTAIIVLALGAYCAMFDEELACRINNITKPDFSKEISRSIEMRGDGLSTTIDFRKLHGRWDKICFADVYAPGSPVYPEARLEGLVRLDKGPCWYPASKRLTLLLVSGGGGIA